MKLENNINRYIEKISIPEANVRIAWKKGRGKTLVCIHGLGCSLESFSHAFDMLDVPVLAFDLPGFGDSKPNTETNIEYTMESFARFIFKLLSYLEIENVVIAGHSMGGAIGVHLVPLLLGRCRGFANLEGNLTFMDCTFSSKIAEMPYEKWLKEGKDLFLNSLNSEAEKRNDNSLKAYVSMARKAKPEALYYASKSLVEESKSKFYLERYIKMRIPTLYFYGEKNEGLFDGEIELIKNKKEICYIKNAGHFMMLDNPEHFYLELDRFIKTV
ncbi:MAG: alpha/beta hydrolase [Thermoplasmata archaeon]